MNFCCIKTSIKITGLLAFLFSSQLVAFDEIKSDVAVSQTETNLPNIQTSQNNEKINEKSKQNLIEKLNNIAYFNADFTQKVVDEAGEVLQEGIGTLAIKKPDLVHWKTTEPDETLIVSDGQNLWFYDPFIEQATVYSLKKAIMNTPILLLTTDDKTLWDAYHVAQTDPQTFIVYSLDSQSQVKSLTLVFHQEALNQDQLAQLIIEDSTGQLSYITLTSVNNQQAPDLTLFNFILPEGVNIDDQR